MTLEQILLTIFFLGFLTGWGGAALHGLLNVARWLRRQQIRRRIKADPTRMWLDREGTPPVDARVVALVSSRRRITTQDSQNSDTGNHSQRLSENPCKSAQSGDGGN